MTVQSDHELLKAYVERRLEPAFTELVRRHVDFVYSAAIRMVCDAHLAEDVTQGVFIALAKQAPTLVHRTTLAGWLHRTAQNIAAQNVRTIERRRAREQEAAAMNELLSTMPDASWEDIAPHLDAALGELSEPDHEAVLLRYFEKKSAVEMASLLGITDDAAQKRVSRAVEKLRDFFAKRKITIGASGLVVLISANAVQSAPVGLAAAVSTTALAGTAVSASTAITATKTIAMTTLQKTIIGAALAAAVGTGVFEAHQVSQLRSQVQTYQQEQAPLAEQIRRLQRERDNATNQLAGLLAANAQLQSSANETELLKLRGEVTQLQYQTNDPTAVAAKAWLDRVNQLKQWADQNPAATIPEFKQFLYNQDWLAAARSPLSTDADYRRAMSNLRDRAEENFADELEIAVTRYKKANNGQFPTDLNQLQSYFDSPVDEAVLQRWEIVPRKTLSGMGGTETPIITQKTAVDDLLDQRFWVDPNGSGSTDFLYTEIGNTLAPVYKAFSAANNGQSPAGLSQLAPYASTPEQKAAVQKLIEQQQLKSAP